jgi:hypothetical protein
MEVMEIVGVKDLCYPTYLINYSLYEKRQNEGKWEEVEEAIEPLIKELMKTICLKDDLGQDASLEYEKLDIIYYIAEYLFTLREKIISNYVCGVTADASDARAELKFDCVRETLNCKYNLGALFDLLAQKIGIPKGGRLGINYMTINVNDCNIFKVHKTK